MRVTTTVMWFRRDLRLADHPALLAAVQEASGRGVVPLFVLDPALWAGAGPSRRCWLARSLQALHAATGGALVVRTGRPASVVATVAQEAGAVAVHVTADTGPYGRRRDTAVERALAEHGRRLVRTGTPYAIGPGSLVTQSGTPFKVFGAFARAWRSRPHPPPAPTPTRIPWARLSGEPPPAADCPSLRLPAVGERAAQRRWETFLERIDDYAGERDRPDHPGTSRLSAHLKYGEIHPRTLLADLTSRRSKGAASFATELVWREFYADVLWHRPDSAWHDYRPELRGLVYDEPDESFDAWRQGRTGYPFVDAGMRQLHREGWMHNRARMVAASFLVKDLHVRWQHGAREFLHRLTDGDLASNNHGWQWVAGTGTDAAPYVRVFNPVTQGQRFDPDGDYVRRYVPELGHLPGASAHEPWKQPDGYARGYPRRIVDHGAERAETLERYATAKRSSSSGP